MSKWNYNGNVVLANLDSEFIVNLQNLLKDIGDSAYNQGFEDGKACDECGCIGCAFENVEEWEMPCAKCKRSCKDYWRAKKNDND